MNKPDVTDYNGLKQIEPGLPARWYHDAGHHRREMVEIWQRSWIYACRASDIAEPLSYRTLKVGDQNLLVLRTSDGKLKAYHNSCRHRGSLLCTATGGRLSSKLIVCPYHQWSYAADDGRLVRTTSFAEPAGFDKADYPLFDVALAEWRGMIFVNMDKTATWDAVAEFQRDTSNFDNYPLEDMVTVATWRKVMKCNWKTFWENFNECLHCPNIHPELCDLVPVYGRRISSPMDAPGWRDHAGSDDPKLRGGLRAGAETWSSDGSAQGHVIPSLTAAEAARGQTYGTGLPSVFIGGYADHVRIVRLLPLAAEETELSTEWLLTPETAADPDYDRSKIVGFAKLVMQQDLEACEINQAGLHAAPLEHGVLMPEEHYVKLFHDWVRNTLSG